MASEKQITGIINWLNDWFYTQTQVDNLLNGISTSNGQNNITDYYLNTTTDEITLEYSDGKLIDTITKTTNGLTDTYTITYTDNTTYQFTVTNSNNITIADNLTTNDSSQVLSAKQGKVLNDKIGSAITYIVGNNE